MANCVLANSGSNKMEYYIFIDNRKIGPYNINELYARGIDATTLVMPEGTMQWTPAWKINELRELLTTEKSVQPTAENIVMEDPTQEIPLVEAHPINSSLVHPIDRPRKHSRSGCLIVSLIILISLTAILIFSCPTTADHKEALANVVTATVNDAVNDADSTRSNDWMSHTFQSITKAFAGKMIAAAVDNLITVDNYIVCSVGKVHYDRKDYIVSLGLLGHVFTINKDDLRKASELYYDKAELKVKDEIKKKMNRMLKEDMMNPLTDMVNSLVGSSVDGVIKDMIDGNTNVPDLNLDIDSI